MKDLTFTVKLDSHKEIMIYRGEEYPVTIETTVDPKTGERYTTTETDQRWWEELRSQYISRHPEALEEFIRTFPEDHLEKLPTGGWKARWKDYDDLGEETRIGETKEKALYNLYLCLAV